LAKEIKKLNLGININEDLISILLFADDMVLIANTEAELQIMLNKMNDWCKKWGLTVNQDKSQIVHFRGKKHRKTNYNFQYDSKQLKIVKKYKYLGVYMDENLTYNDCINSLSESAGRALGSIIGKFKRFKDIGYRTFCKLYSSCVSPILDYGATIWGYHKSNNTDIILNKAIRYYLGVHKYAPNIAIQADIGWLNDKYRRFIPLLRYWNRLQCMSEDRLTKKVFSWDYLLLNSNSWSNDLQCVFESLNML